MVGSDPQQPQRQERRCEGLVCWRRLGRAHRAASRRRAAHTAPATPRSMSEQYVERGQHDMTQEITSPHFKSLEMFKSEKCFN